MVPRLESNQRHQVQESQSKVLRGVRDGSCSTVSGHCQAPCRDCVGSEARRGGEELPLALTWEHAAWDAAADATARCAPRRSTPICGL